MKSAYEIAWTLMGDGYSDIGRLSYSTGLDKKVLEILKEKNKISWFLLKNDLSLVKQVVEEIDQGKPHWEIEKEMTVAEENLMKNVEKTCLEYLKEVDQVIILQSIYDTLIEIRNILEVKNE